MPNYLDTLIAKIHDPALQALVRDEIARLRDHKEFGLIFERHLPEMVRLFTHPVKRGVKVQERIIGDSPIWTVNRVVGGNADLTTEIGGKVVTAVRPTEELVVIREFGDPIVPGLIRVGQLERR